MMWEGHIPKGLFHTLEILEVCYDESAVLPLHIVQRFHNLEKLSLYSGSYERIFSREGIGKQAKTLVKMRKLFLSRLNDLNYMWKQDSRLDLVLQNLEVLEVDKCGSLITLMAPFASFQNLTILEVKSCKNLMNLVTSSTAKSLVQLIKMKISHCYKITEVIENQEDRAEDTIIFSKLKSLSLKSLLCLRSFCSGNYILEFPSLEKLSVKGSNMEIFSTGVLSTPVLRKVKIILGLIEPVVDLNKTIQQLYKKEVYVYNSFFHH
ncbi:hypothetical protein Ddye_025529 [Dipteronia dyeriana]|uniref:Disease resistance protein At4g27190-like leucine-rich repeats domain-containing protein n=1 Tax=Dipteronia dyeriana TaxID=168575 RepID=A0AAD9TKD4_9ROSI|nr:hypothetical protein Ddye_025529 [Dipteronia dyeriana]